MLTDRVTYAKGPDNEVAVIHRIYQMYLVGCVSDTSIARRGNLEGVEKDVGRTWSRFHVKQALMNDKYAGTLVFNRSTQRLKGSRRANAQAAWVTVEDAFDAIVSRELMEDARAERNRRRR